MFGEGFIPQLLYMSIHLTILRTKRTISLYLTGATNWPTNQGVGKIPGDAWYLVGGTLTILTAMLLAFSASQGEINLVLCIAKMANNRISDVLL